MPSSVPAHDQIVWVRLASSPTAPPFLAVWNAAVQDFTSDTNDLLLPWWAISRWKPSP